MILQTLEWCIEQGHGSCLHTERGPLKFLCGDNPICAVKSVLYLLILLTFIIYNLLVIYYHFE